MPAVSIITPVYIDIPDKIVWLDEMLESVLSQSMQDWEVILVDDFSDILIGELKWKYQDEKRFRWFRTAGNSGPAKTRNVAVALAESDAILPLDSDDALPTNVALERMYDAWNVDRSKIVYGNLQWLEIKDGKFERSKTYVLDPYTFKNAMNLGGIIPVTAMHSVACHNAIGGWKAELEFGREDVEYIINAGKHGFCGHKIEETTLLYRKHNDSRDYKLRYEHKLEREVRDQIREMHADIFAGRFPVGCCGGNTSTVAGTSSPQTKGPSEMVSTVMGKTIVTYLPEGKYKPEDTWWVKYKGPKRGGRGAIFGPGRKESYNVRGTGHIFQIHIDDREVFSKRSGEYDNAEKLEYLRPQVQPEPQPQPKPIPQPQVSPEVAPELAVIERMDRTAMESRGIPIVQEQPLPEPKIAEVQLPTETEAYAQFLGVRESTENEEIKETLTQASIHNLGDLDLGTFESTLTMDSWTVELLAEAQVGDLTGYPRIGPKRAQAIIDSARSLING